MPPLGAPLNKQRDCTQTDDPFWTVKGLRSARNTLSVVRGGKCGEAGGTDTAAMPQNLRCLRPSTPAQSEPAIARLTTSGKSSRNLFLTLRLRHSLSLESLIAWFLYILLCRIAKTRVQNLGRYFASHEENHGIIIFTCKHSSFFNSADS